MPLDSDFPHLIVPHEIDYIIFYISLPRSSILFKIQLETQEEKFKKNETQPISPFEDVFIFHLLGGLGM